MPAVDLTELIKIFGKALREELARGIANFIKNVVEPIDYAEVARKYGTEGAPIPPLSVVALTAVNPAAGAIGNAEFIVEEAMQMTGFGLMGLIRSKEWGVAQVVLENLKELWRYGMTLHETLGPINPLTYVSYGLNFKAVAAMMLAYEFMITRNLIPGVKEEYDKIEEWYEAALDELRDRRKERIKELDEWKRKQLREITNWRSDQLKAIMDKRKKRIITYEEWKELRSKIWDKYYEKREAVIKQYDEAKDAVYDEFRPKFRALAEQRNAKIEELSLRILKLLIKNNYEIYGSVEQRLEEIAKLVARVPKVEIPEVKPPAPPAPAPTPPTPAPPKPRRVKKCKWIYSGFEPPDERDKEEMRKLGYWLEEVKEKIGVTGRKIYYARWCRWEEE